MLLQFLSQRRYVWLQSAIIMMLPEEEEEHSFQKSVNLILNGRSDLTLEFKYLPPLSVSEIYNRVEGHWLLKVKRLRIFNCEGVEFYTDDLRYLKDSERIYVSLKGEDFDVNSSYGEYQVLKELGEGGFGKVFLAKHRQIDQMVAIKLMKVNSISQAGQIDSVFIQAQNLKSLNHPNIIEIIKCYAFRDMQVVVVMEYMEGGELLKELHSRGKFTEEEAKVYFKQMVNAIAYCHSKNIVHRDLKLENILVKKQGETHIKVADFGISGMVKEFDSNSNIGTLKYMSPEILSGAEKGTTPGIDVWALGVILYYMTMGKLPFVGSTSSETIRLITHSSFVLPNNPEPSSDLRDLLASMLTKDPRHRITIPEIIDHSWLKTSSFMRALSTQTQSFNVPKRPQKMIRESVDFIGQKKVQKYPSVLGGMRGSVSIPKRLQKQKGNIVRELLKYGKVRSTNQRNEVLRKPSSLKVDEGKFRKCFIQ